jgi:hypothetical protein
MKEQERKEIIDCLEFVANQFEADRTRTKELIEAMKKINCETEFTHLQQLKLKQLVDTCCNILDYDNKASTNASRDVVEVEKRRAIYYFTYAINGFNPQIFYGLAKAFSKHRTSFNHHVKKAQELLDCNDKTFMFYYNRLLTHQFDLS